MKLNKNTYFLVKLIISTFNIYAQDIKIVDDSHFSNVLGEMRNYRLFLPDSYDHTNKCYPVIYYYHGWSQRYFGSINDLNTGEGESNNGDNIVNYVANNEVIVVKTDGINSWQDEEYNLRPYNIGPLKRIGNSHSIFLN